MEQSLRQTLMTAEELFALPSDDLQYELLSGCLLSEPSPGYRHGRMIVRISSLLDAHARSCGLGGVVSDVGFILSRDPDTVRAPDISFVSKDRLASFVDRTRYFPGSPDLAVEVLSPGDRPGEVHGKVADYLAAGTAMVWVVDPEAKSIAVYRSLFSPRTLTADQELSGEDVLPGFAVPASTLFAD